MESSMEENSPPSNSESIPIDAPEPEICLPEFPVKRQETVIGFQAGHRIVRVQSKDPVTGQPIYQRVKLVHGTD